MVFSIRGKVGSSGTATPEKAISISGISGILSTSP